MYIHVCIYVWSEHNLHISMARCYRGDSLPFNHFLHAMLCTNQLTQHLLQVHVHVMLLHVHVTQYILLLYICIHVVTCTCYTIHPAIVYMHTCCYMYMLHNTSCYCIYAYMLLHVHVVHKTYPAIVCIHIVTCTCCTQYILLLYIRIHVVQDIYAYVLLHVLHVVHDTCTTCST